MGDHHGNRRQRSFSRALEQGQAYRQKAPFVKDICQARLQMEGRVRELAQFNLGIDRKSRSGCDLVALKVRDVCHGDQVTRKPSSCSTRRNDRSSSPRSRGQPGRPTGRIKQAGLEAPRTSRCLCRLHDSPHLGTRQYARILGHHWVDELGLTVQSTTH